MSGGMDPLTTAPVVTHVLGPTLMPARMLPRFYAPLAERTAHGSPVSFHAMPERGGTGRTDRVVAHFRRLVEDAGHRGQRVRLAGHSLGGIVAWVLAHDYPEVVAVAELWCAPVRGTARARISGPVAESRFLAPGSRWLRRYDRPLGPGPFVRTVFSVLDQLATPALEVCAIEGRHVENHVVTPLPLRERDRHPQQWQHRGVAGHTRLPRRLDLHQRLAAHDADTAHRTQQFPAIA